MICIETKSCCPTYLMNLQEILILEHVSNTGANGYLLPCFEGVLSIFNGGIELVVSGLRDLANNLLGSLSSLRWQKDLQG